jgi:cyclopropane-fatty-acyl-phospholipid synthase
MFYEKTEKAFLNALEKAAQGSFTFENHQGRTYAIAGKNPGPHAHLKLHTPEVLWNMAAGGDTAMADDYRVGKWDSDDIAALVDFGFRNEEAVRPFVAGSSYKRVLASFAALLKPNTRRRSKVNVMAHYDLGNDFYSLWLDKTMTYSSALFAGSDKSLEEGQISKYDRILERLDGTMGDVLEIGCGWGGFAERAIERDGRHVTGLTLSPAQAEYARARLQEAGDQVDIRIEDYRDERRKYNAIVSIEMFEAVGERYWKTYFERLAAQLASSGKAVIQTITVDSEYFERYRNGGDAVRAYIFPGGMLPSEKRFAEEATRAGLRVTDTCHFGEDYATTLDRWLSTFDAKCDEVRALGYDEKFIRLWRFYLASCAGAFRCGRTNVMQVDIAHA